MKRAIAWFAGNPVAANLLMAVLLVGGLLAAPSIPQKSFPDIDIDWINITAAYPGAAPEEVEKGVCTKIEEEILDVSGLDRVGSTSAEGMCAVTVEVLSGADANAIVGKLKNRVDAIRTFPEDVETPQVAKIAMKRPVIDIAVSGPGSPRALKVLGQRVRDEIAALKSVTQVELGYVSPYEISIEVSEETLRRHGLNFDQVVRAVQRSSLDLPGGSIKTEGGEILLRSTGQAYDGREFEDIVVLTRTDGTRLTLGEIAQVRDGFEETFIEAHFDGDPAVMVNVYRVGDQDVVEISDEVKAYVAEARERMPEGIRLTIWQDDSEALREQLSTLFRNAAYGLVLVLAVLALFLRFRLAIWVSIGVPVAFLGALAALPFLGVSLNTLSLFAFIVALGIVVDDAIVVSENVYTHEVRSGDRKRAAVAGTQEVAIPVIFGVLTTVAAFFPLVMVPGPMGQIFSIIGIVVIACLFFSLVESQLVLPAHLAGGRSKRTKHATATGHDGGRFVDRWRRFQEVFAHGLERFIHDVYQPILGRAIEWRYVSVAIGVGVLVLALGLVASGRMEFAFFSSSQADHIAAAVSLPQGTPVERTREAVATLERSVAALRAELDPEYASPGESLVRHTLSAVGTQPFHGGRGSGGFGRARGGSHVGEVVIELVPSEWRTISTRQVAQRWRALTPDMPDAAELSFKFDRYAPGEAINIQLHGHDIAALEAAAERVKTSLADYPGVHDIEDSFRAGKQELKLTILDEAEPLGLTMDHLARQVRQAFYGEEVQRLQRRGDEIKVMVRYPADERRSLYDLENMRIRSEDGTEVPFSKVARAELGRGYSAISRMNGMRIVNVTADIDRKVANPGRVLADFREGALAVILSDYPGVTAGFEGEQREQFRSFSGLGRGYVMALLAIYALLAVPLRSYWQPLIIMSVIPFGIVGAVVGHLIMGQVMSFLSVIGIAAVSGVVVNASLVLVHFVNDRVSEGMPVLDAVKTAGMARFRPIVLTALTTFAGLTPLMLEKSLQAQMLIPMAISLAFGVVFSAFITLLLVPCGYFILDDIGGWLRRQFGKTSEPEHEDLAEHEPLAPQVVPAGGSAAGRAA